MSVPTIEDAERICSVWNNFKLNEKQFMRVCIHPYSYRKRPAHILSRHPLFQDVFDPVLAKKFKEAEEIERQQASETTTPQPGKQEPDQV